MVGVAFPMPSLPWSGYGGYQSLISLPNTLMFFSFYHFELSASCWCYEEARRGGAVRVCLQGEADRLFLTLQKGEVKSLKKKFPTQTQQTFITQSVLELN